MGRPIWVPAEVRGFVRMAAPTGGEEVCAVVVTRLEPPIQLTLPRRSLVRISDTTGLDDCSMIHVPSMPEIVYATFRRALEGRNVTAVGDNAWLAVNPCAVEASAADAAAPDRVPLLCWRGIAHYVSRKHPVGGEPARATSTTARVSQCLYDVAHAALQRALNAPSRTHSLVFTGARGSGKSEAAKAIIQYLVARPVAMSLVGAGSAPDAFSFATAARRGPLGAPANPWISTSALASMASPTRRAVAGGLLTPPPRRDAALTTSPPSSSLINSMPQPDRALLAGISLLETFGSCGASSSSHFLRLVHLAFDKGSGARCGAVVEAVLLQRWRVAGGACTEMRSSGLNFNAFYALLAGAPATMRSDFRLGSCDDYLLLDCLKAGGSSGGGATSPGTVPRVSSPPALSPLGSNARNGDNAVAALSVSEPPPQPPTLRDAAATFAASNDAFAVLGVSPATTSDIWRLLSALLMAGNVVVSDRGSSGDSATGPGTGAAEIANPSDALLLADLLGVDRASLLHTLLRVTRGVVSAAPGLGGGGVAVAAQAPPADVSAVTFTFRRADDARAALRALIATAYERLFSWITELINSAVAAGWEAEAKLKEARIAGRDIAVLSLLEGAAWDTAAIVAPVPRSVAAGATTPARVPRLELPAPTAIVAATDSDTVPPELQDTAPQPSIATAGDLDVLCSAYAAERLADAQVTCTLRAEARAYSEDGLPAGVAAATAPASLRLGDLISSGATLELLAHPSTGILPSLDVAAQEPRASDTLFAAGLSIAHRRNPAWVSSPSVAPAAAEKVPLLFGVRHTPGGIAYYSADGFIAAARAPGGGDADDDEPLELLLASSRVPLVAQLFAKTARPRVRPQWLPIARRDAQRTQVSQRVARRPPVAALMEDIELLLHAAGVARSPPALAPSPATWVVCVSPNAARQPGFVDPSYVTRQINAAAVLPLVRLHAAGLTTHMSRELFYDTFVLLATGRRAASLPFPRPASADIARLCAALIPQLLIGLASASALQPAYVTPAFPPIVLGLSAVHIRRSAMSDLEVWRSARMADVDAAATLLAAVWRGVYVRRLLRLAIAGLRRMQAIYRTIAAREQWIRVRSSVGVIQAAWRCSKARVTFRLLRKAVIAVQRRVRSAAARAETRRRVAAIAQVTMLARGALVRAHVSRLLRAAVVVQAVVRGFLVRARLAGVRTAAAVAMQAAWRGHWARIHSGRTQDALAHLRYTRQLHAAATSIQRVVRGHLHAHLFRALRAAARVLQRVVRRHLARLALRRARAAATLIQAAVRGALARAHARAAAGLREVADDLWLTAVARAREADELAYQRTVEATTLNAELDALLASRTTGAATAGETDGSSASPGFATGAIARVLDVEVLGMTWTERHDDSDESSPWARAFMRAEADVRAAGGDAVVELAIGSAHCVLLTSRGTIRLWRSAAPAPGFATVSAACGTARHIAAGDEHWLVVSDSGGLYAAGAHRRGQLGIGTCSAGSGDSLIAVAIPDDGSETTSSMRSQRTVSRSAAATRVAAVAAGRAHSLALTEDGRLFVWGAGAMAAFATVDGLLTAAPVSLAANRAASQPALSPQHAPLTDVFEPRLVRLPPAVGGVRRTVRSVSSSADFAALVTTSGEVWTWGAGSCGQLGLGEDVDVETGKHVIGRFTSRTSPTPVTAVEAFAPHHRVVAISCGGNHTLALSSTGRVLAWGSNSHGQLGVGTVGPVTAAVLRSHGLELPTAPVDAPLSGGPSQPRAYVPRPYSASPILLWGLEAYRCTAVAAGGRLSAVLTDAPAAAVLAWGATSATSAAAADDGAMPQPPLTGGAAASWGAVVDSRHGDLGAALLDTAAAAAPFALVPVPTPVALPSVPGRTITSVATPHAAGALGCLLIYYTQRRLTTAALDKVAMAAVSMGGRLPARTQAIPVSAVSTDGGGALMSPIASTAARGSTVPRQAATIRNNSLAGSPVQDAAASSSVATTPVVTARRLPLPTSSLTPRRSILAAGVPLLPPNSTLSALLHAGVVPPLRVGASAALNNSPIATALHNLAPGIVDVDDASSIVSGAVANQSAGRHPAVETARALPSSRAAAVPNSPQPSSAALLIARGALGLPAASDARASPSVRVRNVDSGRHAPAAVSTANASVVQHSASSRGSSLHDAHTSDGARRGLATLPQEAAPSSPSASSTLVHEDARRPPSPDPRAIAALLCLPPPRLALLGSQHMGVMLSRLEEHALGRAARSATSQRTSAHLLTRPPPFPTKLTMSTPGNAAIHGELPGDSRARARAGSRARLVALVRLPASPTDEAARRLAASRDVSRIDIVAHFSRGRLWTLGRTLQRQREAAFRRSGRSGSSPRLRSPPPREVEAPPFNAQVMEEWLRSALLEAGAANRVAAISATNAISHSSITPQPQLPSPTTPVRDVHQTESPGMSVRSLVAVAKRGSLQAEGGRTGRLDFMAAVDTALPSRPTVMVDAGAGSSGTHVRNPAAMAHVPTRRPPPPPIRVNR